MLHTIVPAPANDTVTLGWEIDSDSGLEFGGWNIDDVCLYRPAPAGETFTIDDFLASDELSERVELSWTQPAAAAATAAVVVRRDDRYPTDREDGEVVWSGPATPGEAVLATDASAGGYYAVFAGGDAGWMTGAVEGDNADMGTALDADGDGLYDGGPADDGPVVLGGGCGCDAGNAGAGALLGAAASVLVLLRRRRG
jgi:hypothetical protein